MMCLYVEDERTHLDSGQRRARVQHQCKECGRRIDPGETYRYWTVIDHEWGGGVETEKMCAHCWNTIELGCAFTGCPKAWWWEQIHDMSAYDEGGFVADILREHALTTSQKRAMVRCVRHYKRRWRDANGVLLPLVTDRADTPASTSHFGSIGEVS